MRNRWVVALFAVVSLCFAAVPVRKDLKGLPNKDYVLWHRTGEIVRAGGDVYPHGSRFPFLYPPSAAAILGIAGAFGSTVLVLLLAFAHTVAWAGSVRLSVTLSGPPGPPAWLLLVPSIAVIVLIFDVYMLGQPNLFLLLLVLLSFACLRAQRQVAAGALVATAAAIKAFPVLILPYLLWRRFWRASAAAVIVLALWLLAAPMLFRPPAKVAGDLATWSRGMLLTYDERTIGQRPDRAYSFKNQSLVAVAHRLLRDVPADGERDDAWRVNLVSLSFGAVNAIVAAILVGLGLVFLATLAPRDRRTQRSDAIEFAMLTILVTVASPLSFNYAYVWMIFPATLALRLAAEPAAGRGRRLWAGAALALPATWLLAPTASQAYGNLLFPALILFAGLAAIARAERAAEPSPTSRR